MTTTRVHVPRMDCATEKEMIGRRLAGVAGIKRVEYDLLVVAANGLRLLRWRS